MWVRSLASLNGLRILHCHEPWHRSRTLDLVSLWLWHRPAPVALIDDPLAWEPPHAEGVDLKIKKKKKINKIQISNFCCKSERPGHHLCVYSRQRLSQEAALSLAPNIWGVRTRCKGRSMAPCSSDPAASQISLHTWRASYTDLWTLQQLSQGL